MSDPALQEQMRQFYDQVMSAFVRTYAVAQAYATTPTAETQAELVEVLERYNPFFQALVTEDT